MKGCDLCKREISKDFYLTQSGRIYCYDCWMNERNRALTNEEINRQEYRRNWEQLESVRDNIREIEYKESQELNKSEEYRNKYFLKQCSEELSCLKREEQRLEKLRPRLPYNEILSAKHFDSEPRLQQYLLEKAKAEEMARQEAEQRRIEEERKAKQLAEKQAREEEKRNIEIKQNQQIIAPLEQALLNGNKLTWGQRVQVAKYTENKKVINKLKYDNSTNVLNALLSNPFVSVDFSSKVRERLYSKQHAAAENKAYRKKLEQENNGGCLSVIMLFVVTSITTIMILCI